MLQHARLMLQIARNLLQNEESEALPPRSEPLPPRYMQQSPLSGPPRALDLQQNSLDSLQNKDGMLQIRRDLQHFDLSGARRKEWRRRGILDLQHGLLCLQQNKGDLQHVGEGLLHISVYLQQIDRLLQHGEASRPPARRCRRARILQPEESGRSSDSSPVPSGGGCSPNSKSAFRRFTSPSRLRWSAATVALPIGVKPRTWVKSWLQMKWSRQRWRRGWNK